MNPIKHFLLLILAASAFTGCSQSLTNGAAICSFDLHREPGSVICDQNVPQEGPDCDRIFRHVTLDVGCAGEANFVVSLPKEIPEKGLPTVLVLGGMETSENSLEYIPEHQGYAIVALQYPKSFRQAQFLSFLTLTKLRHDVHSVPQQVVSIASWVCEQGWCNGVPPSLIGISLGGIFMPATYHLAQIQEIPLGPGVFAFTGAGLFPIAYTNAPGYLPFLRYPLALWSTSIFRDVEPARHLPCIEGKFLIINGICDTVIPKQSSCCLERMLQETPDVIYLPTTHILPDREDIIDSTYSLAKEWLTKARGGN